MGNLCCGAGDAELRRRLELLKEGTEFSRKSALLGVIRRSERVHVQLNGAATRLLWRPLPGPGKTEELPLYRVARACPSGASELVLLSLSGQKLLELSVKEQATRDLWVQTLDELCSKGESSSKTDAADSDELTRQEDKHKERYWKDRSTELEQRRLDAEARKQKLGLTGMKYTAQAMARR